MTTANTPTLKVALLGEKCDGHGLRILNRFNNLAIHHGGLQSLQTIKCDDKVELAATFTSPEQAHTFEETLTKLLEKDKADHDPSIYHCKFTTLVI